MSKYIHVEFYKNNNIPGVSVIFLNVVFNDNDFCTIMEYFL